MSVRILGKRKGVGVIVTTGFVDVRIRVSVRTQECVFCNRISVYLYNCPSVMDTYDGVPQLLCASVNGIMMCAADGVCICGRGVLFSSVVVREMALCGPVGVGKGARVCPVGI